MAHYLTFNTTSGITINVNGTAVSSGYQLQNGDVITVEANIAPSNVCYCTVNNTYSYNTANANAYGGSINISNQNIYIETRFSGGGSGN